MSELEDKYIELLLKKCLNFNNSKILFLSYMIKNDFIDRVVEKAKEMGVEEVYLYDDSLFKKHDILSSISLEEIDNHPFFNRKIWDEYALKGASFLRLDTEVPNLMIDIDEEKIARSGFIERTSCPIYKKLQLEYKIPWCIANIPNKYWANALFPKDNTKNAYDKLFKYLCSMCMIDTKDPIESWNTFLKNQEQTIRKLNALKASTLHYLNSLGTDLVIGLDKDAIWTSAGSLARNMLVNMPSYEAFTTPDFHKTNGIVYSSKPLMYNGALIDEFYLVFKDGKVVDFDAKEGKKILEVILKADDYSSYLGEAAIVNYDSPISNTKIVFLNTTIDENSSCHLALGNGFPECISNYKFISYDDFIKKGVNPSKNHVDFMIGTRDLSIEAQTNQGKKLILKNGNINI